MNTNLFRHGFVLILLSLIGGLFIPTMAVPRLGLSAHTIGILSGVLLISIGSIWSHFQLSNSQALVLKGSWLYASYVNWLACFVGAILGTGQTTPVASGGLVGTPMAEGIVGTLLISVVIASFIAVSLSLWGLRPQAASTPQQSPMGDA